MENSALFHRTPVSLPYTFVMLPKAVSEGRIHLSTQGNRARSIASNGLSFIPERRPVTMSLKGSALARTF